MFARSNSEWNPNRRLERIVYAVWENDATTYFQVVQGKY